MLFPKFQQHDSHYQIDGHPARHSVTNTDSTSPKQLLSWIANKAHLNKGFFHQAETRANYQPGTQNRVARLANRTPINIAQRVMDSRFPFLGSKTNRTPRFPLQKQGIPRTTHGFQSSNSIHVPPDSPGTADKNGSRTPPPPSIPRQPNN